MAGRTAGEAAEVASAALVTSGPGKPLSAEAAASGSIALESVRPLSGTVTGLAPEPWIAPIVLLALRAAPTPKSWPAITLASEHVAVQGVGMFRMAVAGFTSLRVAEIPVVDSALVTAGTNNMGAAGALPHCPVTVAQAVSITQ